MNPSLHALHLCQRSRQSRYTFAFYSNFCEVCKKKLKLPVWHKKKKTKKLKRNFECPYLANGCYEFNQICCVAYPTWGTAIMQKWCVLETGPWSYARMKKLFSFFLLIYSRCGRQLSWPHDTVCLDNAYTVYFVSCTFYIFTCMECFVMYHYN